MKRFTVRIDWSQTDQEIWIVSGGSREEAQGKVNSRFRPYPQGPRSATVEREITGEIE